MQQTQLRAQRSKELSDEIAKYIPGGVDSPFRSFKDVGGHTLFFSRGNGSRLFDVDGNEYIDYLGAWGPAIMGHCPPEVVAACKSAVELGAVFGAPHELELEMARAVTEIIPGMERVRFVNSGTEAVMSAVRLARGATGRNTIVMMEGCYHGHSDSVLASQQHSSSKGIPPETSQFTALVPYNDAPALDAYLSQHHKDVAAVLIEPVAGSMGVVPPDVGYLAAVSNICKLYDVLLIFDEVLTGLRIARGGAQELYDVKADLVCFGKALGGGMPIGAYGGSQALMDQLEPIGKVYQAGTFSGNPVTMAGGIQTLKLVSEPGVYERLEARAAQLETGVSIAIEANNYPVRMQRVGSMFALMFAPHPVRNFKDHLAIDTAAFAKFFHHCLANGVYLPPSAVDAAAVSAAHTLEDIERTIDVFNTGLASVFAR
jgi:glutamate-1-semialdehyde 2,1-aminomutase